MKLSVIIACYNAEGTIGVQLSALADQICDELWEVIVADNGSTDNSVSVVHQYKSLLPNLRVVDASDVRGQAHARNVGARAATGEALAFVDADDEVAPGWVAAISEALSQHDFVACRIDTEKLNAFWIHKLNGTAQHESVQKTLFYPFFVHAGGGTLGIKSSRHQQIGGFDESLPPREDTDYCFRLQLLGLELHFVPEAVVHVRLRDTLPGIFRQARLWGELGVLVYKKLDERIDTRIERPWISHIRMWQSLLKRLPQLRYQQGRAAWIRSLGFQVGRLRGSIKHRVPPIPV
jgi:glycosyltransferase involved in cell wall biosynthesis